MPQDTRRSEPVKSGSNRTSLRYDRTRSSRLTEHPWCEHQESGRTTAATCETQESKECKSSNTCEKQIESCKVGAEDWLLQNYVLNKDFTFANYQIQQQAVLMAHQRTKVMRMMSIMDPSLVEPISVTSCVPNRFISHNNLGSCGVMALSGSAHEARQAASSLSVLGARRRRGPKSPRRRSR